ncbi:P-loop NTPase [Candidatus Woesearchaeota archaeon]|nr:P-loop NTPase [Candidatus Woesearchaeota archaeon]
MTKTIGIISGKGGVGKTSSSINLGAALNFFGKDVVVLDANFTTPNVGLHLGAPVVPISIHHVLQGKNKIREAVYLHPSGLKIIPGGISIQDLKNVNPDKLAYCLNELNNEFIILDAAAGLGREALSTIKAADEILIVTNPELPAVTDALKTIKVVQEFNKKVIGVILARTQNNEIDLSIKNIESLLDKPVISIIPEDKSIRKSLLLRDPVVYTHPKSESAIAYKKLAAYLLGKNYEEVSESEEKKSMFYGVLKMLGLR